MTKIKNTIAYKIKTPLSLSDYAVGTNNEDGIPGYAKGQTISIGLNEMRELFLAGLSPETGGTLKITEIVPDTELTSISAVANAISPAYAVQRYEFVAIDLNGVIYLLKEQNITFGLGQTALADSDFIKFTSIVNKGTGQALATYNPTLKQWEVLTIDSDTLTKTVDADGLHLEIPSTSTIPALYVNDLYIPTEEEFLAGNTKGNGSLAKPFTNTVTAYVDGVPTITANSAIQNALDAYVGTGTRLAPQLVGQKIEVQDNSATYNFLGNFGYSRLNIKINANVIHAFSGMLVDMDNATHFNTIQDRITISVGEGYNLTSFSGGFNNSGSNIATTNFTQSRKVIFLGEGTIYFPGSDITKYIVNSDVSGTGNINDGDLTFDIKCTLRADLQGIIRVGGVSKVYNYASLQSGTSLAIDSSLKAFLLTGGQFRNFKTASIEFGGSNRTDGFVFTPTGGFSPQLIVQSATIVSSAVITNLFNKTNNNTANLTFVNSDSSVLFNVTNIFESTNLWSVIFNRNILETGSINSTKANLTNSNTVSVSNSIAGNLIENLVIYGSRALAVAGGLTKGCKFLNRKTVTAGSFVVGVEYQILTIGSSDFTLIGASANTIGINFIASGVGTGTGTAYQHTIDVLI